MSIAALSSSFVGAVRELAPAAPAVADRNADDAPAAGRNGRRSALIDAMTRMIGSDAPAAPGDAQTVLRFAHALMHDLRRLGGSDDAGRGHAWGRRDWSDIAQRIDALATASGAAAVEPRSASGEAPAVPAAPAAAASAPMPAAAPELPAQPSPVTTTSAALHLMQVPTSRLLEAFAALREALGQSTPTAGAGESRAALAEFLGRLSQSLADDPTAALPAGSVVDLRA